MFLFPNLKCLQTKGAEHRYLWCRADPKAVVPNLLKHLSFLILGEHYRRWLLPSFLLDVFFGMDKPVCFGEKTKFPKTKHQNWVEKAHPYQWVAIVYVRTCSIEQKYATKCYFPVNWVRYSWVRYCKDSNWSTKTFKYCMGYNIIVTPCTISLAIRQSSSSEDTSPNTRNLRDSRVSIYNYLQ